MKKKSVGKIRYVLFAFVFAFCVLINVNAPIPYYAAEQIPFDDIRYSFEVQTLTYGEWVTDYSGVFSSMHYGNDATVLGEVNTAYVDHVEGSNARIRIFLETHNFRSDYRYIISDYFEFTIDSFDLYSHDMRMNFYFMNSDNILRPYYFNIGFSSYGYPEYVIEFDCPNNYEYVVLEFEFNIHKIMTGVPEGRYQSLFMCGEPVITYEDKSFKIPDFSFDFDLPEIDADGLPDIDDFLPDGSNPLIDFFSKVMSVGPVELGLVLVSVLGLVSYVLFGKR